MERSPGTRIQICGRLTVELDGRRLEDELPGRQGRLLFAYLAANRLRPVLRDELLEALWVAEPPAAADAGLRALLAKLRRVLGEGVLEGRAELRLVLPEDARVDLEAAREAIHRSEAAAAAEDWSDAWSASQVALFTARRGFLAGAGGDWIDQMRRELDELQVRALEVYTRASLGIGPTELAGAEHAARDLIALAPYRESGYRALMEALAASGNRAEALQVYDGLRVRLREELGVAPSDALVELHRRLLG